MTAKPKPRICGGIFQADPDVPGDPLSRNARLVCICGLLGQRGDTHHPLPDPPAVDVQQLRAGESDPEENSDGL